MPVPGPGGPWQCAARPAPAMADRVVPSPHIHGTTTELLICQFEPYRLRALTAKQFQKAGAITLKDY